jgi:hypothetical protein
LGIRPVGLKDITRTADIIRQMRGIERRLMRRLLGIASFVLTLMIMTAPAASADPDPDNGKARDVVLTCDDGEHLSVIQNGGIHLTDGRNFHPMVVTINGTLVLDNKSVDNSAVPEATCSWTTASGRLVIALGHFSSDNDK